MQHDPSELEPVDDLEFGLPDAVLLALQKSQPRLVAETGPTLKKRDFLRFYKIPTGVLEDVARAANENGTPGPLLVLLALYRLWYTSFQCNPVKLTTHSLEGLGMTRRQKGKALQLLESTGHITVLRKGKKNPWVTLLWLLPSK
jgi:hypothetical protein